MKSGTKLVILTPGFAADELDTTSIPSLQLFLYNLHRQYPEIEIQIVTFHYPFTCYDYVWKGLHVHAAGGAGSKILKPILWIRILKYLFKLKKERGIDIIHSFWLTDITLIGLIFSKLVGTPIVATAMGQDSLKQNKYLRLIRFFSINPITLSGFQANSLKEILNNRILKVIPFGIDSSQMLQSKVERNIDILAVGSLNKTKNYVDFIQIVNSLVKRIPGLNCGIIGKGNELESIVKSINFEGLENHIILHGELPYGKVIEKMQESKILLHTSRFEGQGLIITEALASGAYVVCFPVGIASDLIHEKLVTGNSKEELEQHILSILSMQEQDFTPVIYRTIQQTCWEYYAIYKATITANLNDSR